MMDEGAAKLPTNSVLATILYAKMSTPARLVYGVTLLDGPVVENADP